MGARGASLPLWQLHVPLETADRSAAWVTVHTGYSAAVSEGVNGLCCCCQSSLLTPSPLSRSNICRSGWVVQQSASGI